MAKKDFNLPNSIKRLILGKEYKVDEVGKSQAKILIFDNSVLKIVKYDRKNDETIKVINWLQGKLPVPKILSYEQDYEYQYLLMSKIPGLMSAKKIFFEAPQELIERLAQALKMFWNVNISDCPRSRILDIELEEARYRVENNLVDFNSVVQSTFGEERFENPKDLLYWLESNKPDCEPVLSHGDFCLPNIFIDNNKISGFIDLGKTGVADKWKDIAICYRSLKWNAQGMYGGKVYPNVNPDYLFEALGIKPNFDKLRYYILLDELL